MVGSIIRTAAVVLACAAGPALGQPPALEELPDTRFREAAVAEYDDGALQVIAAYAHAQVRHESRWLFVQVGFGAMESISVRPDDRRVSRRSIRAVRRVSSRSTRAVEPVHPGGDDDKQGDRVSARNRYTER